MWKGSMYRGRLSRPRPIGRGREPTVGIPLCGAARRGELTREGGQRSAIDTAPATNPAAQRRKPGPARR